MKKLFFIMGILISTSLFALDFARESELQNECDHNNGMACLELGSMYHVGNGVAQSFSHARALYEQACNLGAAKGCSSLGYMYESGHSGSNLKKASEFYERACVNGDASGCESLAMLYENGKGVSEDMQKAVDYYDRACSGGASSSCAHLGLLYEQDDNIEYAVIYYQNSCDAGGASECVRLGTMYYTGGAVAQNEERAIQFFKKACELGETTGCKNYEKINTSYFIQ